MNFRRKTQADDRLYFNVTSMVDVMMVLVVFLLLTWSTSRIESELKVELPTSATAPQHSVVRSPVIVNIKPDGKISVNQRELGDKETRSMLEGVVKLDSQQTVILRADKAVPYQRILQVLDLCNQAGVSSVGFGALPLSNATGAKKTS